MPGSKGTPLSDFLEETKHLSREDFLGQHPEAVLVVQAGEDHWARSRKAGGGAPAKTMEVTVKDAKKSLTKGEARVHFLDRAADHDSARRFAIGRRDDNDIVVPHTLVSKAHAYLVKDKETLQYHVVDLGSANGTVVKNHRIEKGKPAPLRSQEAILFGPLAKGTFFLPEDFYAFCSFQRRMGSKRKG